MLLRKMSLLVLCWLLLPMTIHAQAEDPAQLQTQLTALIPAEMEMRGVPGVAVAVVHEGEFTWAAGFGAADTASGAPVTPDTVFKVASISKAVTAWAALQLVEAGKLELDAPVEDYLTRWQFPLTRQKTSEVTIRRLLSHTAGLGTEGYAGFAPGTAVPGVEALLNGEGGQKVSLTFPPGSRFSYSGGGYTVLQLALEETTGQPFADWMRATVLEPLGMADSTFAWTSDTATPYNRQGEALPNNVQVDLAAGGLYTTASDLARFVAVLSDPGAPTGLTDEHLQQMLSPADSTRGAYGLGVFIASGTDEQQVAWHDGIQRGWRTLFAVIPGTGEGLVILTNSDTGDQLYQPILCAWDAWLAENIETFCQSF